jgi:hypothetical protein
MTKKPRFNGRPQGLFVSYTISKGVAEKYTISRQGRDATIYTSESTGEVAVSAGQGQNYAYAWPAPGRGKGTLKEFLISAGIDYITDKFSYGSDKWFNHEESLAQVKRDVIQWRKDLALEKSTARRIWSDIEDRLTDDSMNVTDWFYQIQRCEELMNSYGNDPSSVPCVLETRPDLARFMKNVWPAFIEQLKAEILFEEKVL